MEELSKKDIRTAMADIMGAAAQEAGITLVALGAGLELVMFLLRKADIVKKKKAVTR